MKRIILSGALSLCLAAAWPAQAAPNWPNAPYSFYAKSEDLKDVLQEFASGFSLSLQMGPGIKGTVNGRFNANTPTEFMDKLGGVYGFSWFVYGGTLFVSNASDITAKSISAMGGSITAMHDALLQMGVVDPRFGWGELPDQGIALVSGPPAYVKLVQRMVSALPLGAGGQQVQVFRLKYASVQDRVISYRGQQITMPGVTTILRSLIQGSGSGNNNQVLSAIAAPLRQHPPAFNSYTANNAGDANAPGGVAASNVSVQVSDAAAAGAAAAGAAAAGSERLSRAGGLRLQEPSVQADPRQNAIIVQDIPDRIPIYRQLIEELDKPSTLIQIEAMIVDVDTNLVNQLGVTWGGLAGKTSLGYGDLSLTPSGGLPVASGASLSPGTLGVSVGNILVARLNALQASGQAHILSQPSILTVDNMGAVIDLSTTFYIQTVGQTVATVTPETVGTSLRVTPRYIDDRGDRKVELTVDIEDGGIDQSTTVGTLPTVSSSTISTLAVVGDDQTLLIGGYDHAQYSSQTSKVPILGDIPIIGALFSSRGKTGQQQERLFLLRPRVVAIAGKMISMPRGQDGSGLALSATWGQAAAGHSLNLVDGQPTRVMPGMPQAGGNAPLTVSPDYVAPDSVGTSMEPFTQGGRGTARKSSFTSVMP
ncbi:MAG TPA: type III secretion system outer membrane ring subunit SctC [Bordetella sp.]